MYTWCVRLILSAVSKTKYDHNSFECVSDMIVEWMCSCTVIWCIYCEEIKPCFDIFLMLCKCKVFSFRTRKGSNISKVTKRLLWVKCGHELFSSDESSDVLTFTVFSEQSSSWRSAIEVKFRRLCMTPNAVFCFTDTRPDGVQFHEA